MPGNPTNPRLCRSGFPFLAVLAATGLLVYDLGVAAPLVPLEDGTAARSASGQFVVTRKDRSASAKDVLAVSTNLVFVRLEAGTLAVSAERVKQALWRELAISPPWRGKIHLAIRPARTTNDPVLIGSEQLKDGWRFGVELPEVLDRARYVRALTQCLLLEYATRNLPSRSGEIPTWLVEGLARQLLGSREAEIIVPAPQFVDVRTLASTTIMARRENPLARVRAELATQPGLTFQELSWPSGEDLTGARGELYRNSAHLLVVELAQLPNGQARLRNLLSDLPQHYNWQMAFLRAFAGVFERPLDVEKWWTLQLAHFTGRDSAEAWSLEESWLKLDEVLGAAAQVRASTNDLPQNVRATLQSILRDWKRNDQVRVLQDKLAQLQSLRLRTAPELGALVDEYRDALVHYLEQSASAAKERPGRQQAVQRRISRQTVATLDRLDAQREVLRPALK